MMRVHRLDARAADRLLRRRDDLGMPVERAAHVAVLLLDLELEGRRGSRATTSSASRRTSATCSSSSASSWSRTIEPTTVAVEALPVIRLGWTKPSRPSVVSGESASRGQGGDDVGEQLDGVHELPFAVPGWTPTPRIVSFTWSAENVSISSSPSPEPSSV